MSSSYEVSCLFVPGFRSKLRSNVVFSKRFNCPHAYAEAQHHKYRRGGIHNPICWCNERKRQKLAASFSHSLSSRFWTFPICLNLQETKKYIRDPVLIALGFACVCNGIKSRSDPWLRLLSAAVRNSTPPRFVNSQLVAFCQFLVLLSRLEVVLSDTHGSSCS